VGVGAAVSVRPGARRRGPSRGDLDPAGAIGRAIRALSVGGGGARELRRVRAGRRLPLADLVVAQPAGRVRDRASRRSRIRAAQPAAGLAAPHPRRRERRRGDDLLGSARHSAGPLDVIPVLGFVVAAVPGIILAATVSSSTALLVALLYLVYHAIENYVIAPRVYGNRLRLSNLAVILGFAVGAELAGVIGALIA